METYDAYIFDLDGTLLDTLNDLAASTNYAMRTHHLPEHTIDEVRRFVGNGVSKLIERAVPGGKDNPLFEPALATFREHYLIHQYDTTTPYPGIMPMLRRLKEAGKATAVVSNKFDAATKALCQRFFGPLVDVAIGESASVARKPSPDTVIEALRILGIPSQGATARWTSPRQSTATCRAFRCCGGSATANASSDMERRSSSQNHLTSFDCLVPPIIIHCRGRLNKY